MTFGLGSGRAFRVVREHPLEKDQDFLSVQFQRNQCSGDRSENRLKDDIAGAGIEIRVSWLHSTHGDNLIAAPMVLLPKVESP